MTPGSRRALGWVWMATLLGTAFACGPFFPNSLLADREQSVLQAPHVRLRSELDRLQLSAPSGLAHVPTPDDTSDRAFTLGIEINDLRRDLAGRGLDTGTVARVVLEFSRRRADVEEHRSAVTDWERARARRARSEDPHPADGASGNAARTAEPDARQDAPARPVLAGWEPSEDLPPEVRHYLRGAEAWGEGQTNEARSAWMTVLSLPAERRRFKSTWASYMLGRSWHETDPVRATEHYRQTRRLARTGFSDSLGLAAASLGWEGQLRLRTNDLANALRLYLDQYGAGDTNSALNSIRFTATRILESPRAIQAALARDPVFRRVVTASALAEQIWWHGWENDAPHLRRQATDWLAAIEESGAAEVPLAEQLAVLCYQIGEWEAARRWVDLAPQSAVARWMQAKLLLREGRLDDAAAAMAGVVQDLPLEPEPRPRGAAADFGDSLYVPGDNQTAVAGRREALGELGVLRLSRGEFVQALDALLRAGFWQDAAHVAERVLTLEELRRYVDAHWPDLPRKGAPGTPPTGVSETGSTSTSDDTDAWSPWADHRRPEVQRAKIRHLLARRLARGQHLAEAEKYLPVALREPHARLCRLLAEGGDGTRSGPERARSWFAAACLVRTNGLELLGTEMGPDFAIWDGAYDFEPIDEAARDDAPEKRLGVVRPTAREVERLKEKPADPNLRFHYRYHAASLAWDASKLLPNNDPETAMILYRAGCWVKARDPATADVFYKALVRRCRKTELGEAADRQRWFPELDDAGRPIVTRTEAKAD